jgi:hypothetical protein
MSLKTVDHQNPTTTSKIVALILVIWFLSVATIGHAGLLVGASALLIGGYVATATGMLCVLALTVRPFRFWLLQLELRLLVLMHFVRFVGIAFLVSSASADSLPDLFANRAGYGDIFAAITALALAVGFLPANNQFHRQLLMAWNIVGLLDLLLAVGTGVSIQLSGSEAMAPIVTAPLMYIPFYFVPLLLFIHLVIFYRLAIRTAIKESTSMQS